MKHISQLQQAIRAVHGAESKHVKTTSVHEQKNGDVIFYGEVETFELIDHPKAKLCFAWGYEQDGEFKATCVLALPPVVSPGTAVQAAVMAKAKREGLLDT